MPPQPAARCCRAVHHQISTPLESIWITDSALSQAFERYCSISKVTKRQGSSVPGPLENRRRLGKRNIAELNSLQSHSALPAWALSNAADLSHWKWEAPSTSPAVRMQKGQRTAPAKWPFPTVTLPNWLGDLAEERKAVAPDEMNTRANKRSVQANSASLRDEIVQLASVASSMPASLFVETFRVFCGHFQQQFVLGTIKESEVLEVIGLALATLDAKFEKTPHKDTIRPQYLFLLGSMIDGIMSSRVLSPKTFSPVFWRTLLTRLSEQEVSDEFSSLFTRIIDVMPREYAQQRRDALLAVFESYLRKWREPDSWNWPIFTHHLERAGETISRVDQMISSIKSQLGTGDFTNAQSLLSLAQTFLSRSLHNSVTAESAMSSHYRQVESICRALGGLSSDEHMPLIQSVTGMASVQASQDPLTPETRHQIQYNWLRVLARMPGIRQDYLFQASSSMALAEGSEPLSNVEICQILLDHWSSRGYLEKSSLVSNTFEILNASNDATAIASLASALHKHRGPSRCAGYLYSLWKYLRCLEREDEFVASLKALKQARGLSPRVIKNVAFTSDDHQVALKLHSLSAEHFHKQHLQWGPGFWDKFMDKMAADPTIAPDRILQLLDVTPQARTQDCPVYSAEIKLQGGPQTGKAGPSQTQHPKSSRPVQAQVARVQKAAILLSQAPHLRSRVALRHVERCIRYLGHRNRRWSIAEVTALARILTRDLCEGQPGRTERLRWLLKLIANTFGQRVALQCGLHLKRWRNGNWRLSQQGK